MTHSRRTVLAAGASGALALAAGCLDFARGEGPLELESERVAPTDAALAETGYEEEQSQEELIEETVDVGVERDVRASVWISIYAKELEVGGLEHEGAFFGAISVPDFTALDQSVNPIANMDDEELLEEFLEELEGDHEEIGEVSYKESTTLGILGDERDVTVFEGEAEFRGEPIEVEIELSTFDHEDDLIVLVGSYPTFVTGESENIRTLMESVEHPV